MALVHGCWPPLDAFGGIVRYLLCLAGGLRDRGHHVTVVTCGTTSYITQRVEDGIRVVRVPQPPDRPSRPLQLLTPLVLSARYASALSMVDRVHPIDVVEFSNWASEGFVHALHRRRPHVTRVVTMGWQSRAVAHGAPQAGYAVITDWWRDWTEALPIRRSDLVLSPSRAHADIVAARLGLDSAPQAMALGDGDGTVVAKSARPRSENLLFVGKMEPRKGFDTLVEAFALAYPSLPGGTRLTVAGEDPRTGGASYHEAVLGRVPEHVRDRIDVLGWVSDDALAELYLSCLLVVAPSRYESFGLPFIEAMRHGKAVIGTTAGGIPEVVENGSEGLLVRSNDAMGLAAAIVRLVSDDVLRQRLEGAGRARYEREFTRDEFARRSEAAYKLAIDARTGVAHRPPRARLIRPGWSSLRSRLYATDDRAGRDVGGTTAPAATTTVGR
ncbi:MAG: glycosyltransferase family 4 protein [Solirubrobacteraceae bacterium]